MDYYQLTAPCGLDCFNCPMYLTQNNPSLRQKVAQNLGLAAEQAVCLGCRPQNGTIPFLGMTEPCHVYRCISEKGLDFCCDCSDFPCDHLHPYADLAAKRPHNTKVFNLCLIRKMGLENWAVHKARSVRDTYYKGKFKL